MEASQTINKTINKSENRTAVATGGYTDWYIWGTYIFLIVVSVIELFSASSQEVKVDDIYGPILRHAMFLGIGLLIMLSMQRISLSNDLLFNTCVCIRIYSHDGVSTGCRCTN